MDSASIIGFGKIAAALVSVGTCYKLVVMPVIKGIKKASVLYTKVDLIVTELNPNSGHSLRDSINRIDTGVQRSEERQRALLSMVPLAVLEADSAGFIVYVNRTFSRWTGRSAHEALGEGWLSVVAPEDREQVLREWRECVEQKRAFDLQCRFLDADGLPFEIHYRAYPLKREPGGEPLGYLGAASRTECSMACPLMNG